MCKDCDGYKSELKRLYRLTSKLVGVYKLIYTETLRFTLGLFNTKPYEDGLIHCEEIQSMLDNTKIFD